VTKHYTTEEAETLTTVPDVQIAHFVRSRAIEPAVEAPRRGISHKFSAWQLVEIVLASELVKAGIGVSTFAAILGTVRRQRLKKPHASLLVLWVPGPARFLGARIDSTQSGPDRFYLPRLTTPEGLSNQLTNAGDVVGFAIDIRRVIAVVESATGERL
jgi:hypothetical protein